MNDLRLVAGEHAVLLLHGLAGNPLEMRYVARRLHRGGFAVHVPHIPDYGHHQRSNSCWQDWSAWVEREFDALRRNYRSVAVGGLCIGAVLALQLAAGKSSEIAALALLSTTLDYDGWSIPWYRFLLPYAYHTPLRKRYVYRERSPYGLKNEVLRKHIARAMQQSETTAVGSTSISMDHICNAQKLIRSVRRTLPQVTAPALVIHAIDDETVSPQSAEYVIRNINSSVIRKVLLDDSFHMITLDNEREHVAQEMELFLAEHARTELAPAWRRTAGRARG
jgi:carboxylesterase